MTTKMAGILEPDYPEQMAIRETGRLKSPESSYKFTKLALFPDCLHFIDIIPGSDISKAGDSFRIGYPGDTLKSSGGFIHWIYKTVVLIQYLFVFEKVDLYMLSRDRLHIMMALLIISICKIKGISVSIYDYTYKTQLQSRAFKIILSLCNQVKPYPSADNGKVTNIESRNLINVEERYGEQYRQVIKNRAVPRVLVAGNFSSDIILSLAEETHRLVKQKYPRTEFYLVSLFKIAGLRDYAPASSVKLIHPETENDLVSLYSECDSLILLSPGGLNGMFLSRAKTARFPVILNGFELSDNEMSVGDSKEQNSINVPRDSFSALASAVIDLVDNEEYYRSFR